MIYACDAKWSTCIVFFICVLRVCVCVCVCVFVAVPKFWVRSKRTNAGNVTGRQADSPDLGVQS